ncbi:NAD(P)H:quinone oxidoreductase type IV [Vagococcus acidifermentans]|uniref:NAD(P)H:quinone oxidoreductase, type IV n=1 Tax=Vagococcus acidifermentans TaxID=564710 RepID=A0A430B321_9ENTE|nr:NAD(P)H:quinone oxidoreductase type IV [Vagococcus acidifermentans]RSU14602.1 NAD(P)H:quinone oxidoreductase, type IV [Vagococcus acidifermentans]
MTKLLIAYYSSTGSNTKMAEWAKEAAEAAGAEVRVRKIHELAPDVAIDSNPLWRKNVDATSDIPEASSADLEWADAYIFSSPSRFGVMASQMKQFFDLQGGLWGAGKLANKFVTAFSSAQNPHGGQEQVIQGIYTVMQHWGAIIVPAGFVNMSTFGAGGNPYGTSATIDGEGNMVDEEAVKAAVKDQTTRLLDVAGAYVNR